MAANLILFSSVSCIVVLVEGLGDIRCGKTSMLALHHNLITLALAVEMEQVPDLPLRPGPDEKLALNMLNTRYHQGSNFGKALKLVGYTKL